MNPRVLHISTYDAESGAGRAAYALHSALKDINVESQMMVASRRTDDPSVRGLTGAANRRWRVAQRIDRSAWNLQASDNSAWRSPALMGALRAQAINQSNADVVNLHWVTNGFLSIREIGRIRKPIVWSMYDMWPFSGTEHYGAGSHGARWEVGYEPSNRPAGDGGLDIDRFAWRRKMRLWNQPMTMVPSSAWLADRVQRSAIAHRNQWQISRIPHVIDTDAFAPMDKGAARDVLDLPREAPLIVFLATGGAHDRRKGWDLLDSALHLLRDSHQDLHVAIAGPVPVDFASRSHARIHLVGEVHGNERLRALYASADVVAVPSREDTMPLTAMEAQSCGIPVTAFNIGGLPDIVEHQVTGYLAEPLLPVDFANGLRMMLDHARAAAGLAARKRAVRLWSPRVIAHQYLEQYQRVINAHP